MGPQCGDRVELVGVADPQVDGCFRRVDFGGEVGDDSGVVGVEDVGEGVFGGAGECGEVAAAAAGPPDGSGTAWRLEGEQGGEDDGVVPAGDDRLVGVEPACGSAANGSLVAGELVRVGRVASWQDDRPAGSESWAEAVRDGFDGEVEVADVGHRVW